MVKKGEIYKHFKCPEHTYEIIDIAKDVNNLTDLVIYKALYQSYNAPFGQLWVRSLEEFESCVDGKHRFEKIEK